jgi:hypothetical protein
LIRTAFLGQCGRGISRYWVWKFMFLSKDSIVYTLTLDSPASLISRPDTKLYLPSLGIVPTELQIPVDWCIRFVELVMKLDRDTKKQIVVSARCFLHTLHVYGYLH